MTRRPDPIRLGWLHPFAATMAGNSDFINDRTDPDEIKRLQQIQADAKAREIGLVRMITILKEHQISMGVNGCGCCGSPDVRFAYKGENILDADYCNFDTDDDAQKESA